MRSTIIFCRRRSRASVCYQSRRVSRWAARPVPNKCAGSEHGPAPASVVSCLGVLRKPPGSLPDGGAMRQKMRGFRARSRARAGGPVSRCVTKVAGFPAKRRAVRQKNARVQGARAASALAQSRRQKPLPVFEAERDKQPVKRAHLCHKLCQQIRAVSRWIACRNSELIPIRNRRVSAKDRQPVTGGHRATATTAPVVHWTSRPKKVRRENPPHF